MATLLILLVCLTSPAQTRTLTLDDVKFDEATGTIVSYLSDYDQISISNEFNGVSVRNIGAGVFFNKGIRRLQLPLSLKTIQTAAFSYNHIDSLILPDGVESIGGAAFQLSGARFLSLPQNIKHIADNAFIQNDIPTFTIPPSLDTVGGFNGAGLRVMTIPSTVSVIGDFAFSNNHFDRISIEEGCRKIGKCAFWVEALRVDSTFSGFHPLPSDPHIDSLVIPSSVTDIGYMAFFGQRSIRTLILKNGIVDIGEEAFSFNSIDTLVIPSSVERVGEGAFSRNVMDSLSLGDSVSSLGERAFAFNSLSYVNFPPSLSILPAKCFLQNNIKEVHIPSTVKNVGAMCFAYNNIRSVKVSGSVSAIDSAAFMNNVELSSVTLADGVTSIGQYAFAYCSDMNDESTLIRTLSLPSSLREIKPYAFYRTYITPTRPPQFNADRTKKLTWYRYNGSKDNVLGEVETIGLAGFAHYDSELGFFAVESDNPQGPAGLVDNKKEDSDSVFDIYAPTGRFVRGGALKSVNLPHGVYILRGNEASRKIVVE